MNILLIADFFPHSFRSHEGSFVWEKAKQLAKHHSVVVIAPRVWYPPLKRYAALRYPVSRVPFMEKKKGVLILRPVYRTVPLVGEWVVPYWFLLKVFILLSFFSLQFRLIHAHWAYRAGWWAVLLGRLLRKPVVVTAHGSDINDWVNEPVKRGRIRWALSGASGVIFVSQKLADKAKSEGVRCTKSMVIANGIPSEKFPKPTELAVPVSSKKQILFIGNLVPVKGVDRLLNALSLLKQQNTDWQASLIGDGPEKQKLEQQATFLGLNDHVKFLGRLTNPEAMAKLQKADILVIPSRNEGGPLVLIEALAWGKTVVAFNVGNVADVLNRSELGFVVREETPEALAEAILRGLQSPVNADLARKRASDYSLENAARQIEKFYRTVLCH